LAIEFNIKNKK